VPPTHSPIFSSSRGCQSANLANRNKTKQKNSLSHYGNTGIIITISFAQRKGIPEKGMKKEEKTESIVQYSTYFSRRQRYHKRLACRRLGYRGPGHLRNCAKYHRRGIISGCGDWSSAGFVRGGSGGIGFGFGVCFVFCKAGGGYIPVLVLPVPVLYLFQG